MYNSVVVVDLYFSQHISGSKAATRFGDISLVQGPVQECAVDRLVQLRPVARSTSRTASYEQCSSQVIMQFIMKAMYDNYSISVSRHLEANSTRKHSISLATHPLPQVWFVTRTISTQITSGSNKII